MAIKFNDKMATRLRNTHSTAGMGAPDCVIAKTQHNSQLAKGAASTAQYALGTRNRENLGWAHSGPQREEKKTCPIDSQFLVDGKENKTSSQAVKNAIEYPYPIPSNTDWLATAHISHKKYES